MNTGDRVKILRTDISPKSIVGSMGTITRVDGGYIYVRPDNCTYEIELYDVELELVPKSGLTT